MARFPSEDVRNPLAASCERCPVLADTRTEIAWGNGPLDASVVVVGEAPAAGDPDAEQWRGGNHTGMAYTSRRSGRKVRDLCAEAGLDPLEDCYFTNAVKCFPKSNAGTRKRDPTATEFDKCRPFLRAELADVDPAAVLATGKHATASVLALEDRSVDGFVDAVLDPIECPSLGTTVVPVIHPSYQEVWIPRIGQTYDSYVAAIGEVLERIGAR